MTMTVIDPCSIASLTVAGMTWVVRLTQSLLTFLRLRRTAGTLIYEGRSHSGRKKSLPYYLLPKTVTSVFGKDAGVCSHEDVVQYNEVMLMLDVPKGANVYFVACSVECLTYTNRVTVSGAGLDYSSGGAVNSGLICVGTATQAGTVTFYAEAGRQGWEYWNGINHPDDVLWLVGFYT